MTIVTRDYSPYNCWSLHVARERTVPLSERTANVQRAFADLGLRVLGAVWASPSALDLALQGPNGRDSVVRFTDALKPSDAGTLKTMIAQGDFTRAFLVHTGAEMDLSGEVQVWPLSRIDELAAILAAEAKR